MHPSTHRFVDRFADRYIGHFADRFASSAPAIDIRPACPADAAALSRFLQGLSAASLRWRFHGGVNPAALSLAQGMVTVDGARNVALLALQAFNDGEWVLGEARYALSERTAEFAISVADAQHGRGVARRLLRALAAHAAAAGATNLVGDVCADNSRMIAFAQRCGFELDIPFEGSDEVLRIHRRLRPALQPLPALRRWWQRRNGAAPLVA